MNIDIHAIWLAAIDAEQSARNAAERFHADNVVPVYAAHDAGGATLDDTTAQEEAYGAITSAHADAVEALILTPAPSFKAVVQKLRLGCEDWFFDGSSQATAALGIIAADVERLSGEA